MALERIGGSRFESLQHLDALGPILPDQEGDEAGSYAMRTDFSALNKKATEAGKEATEAGKEGLGNVGQGSNAVSNHNASDTTGDRSDTGNGGNIGSRFWLVSSLDTFQKELAGVEHPHGPRIKADKVKHNSKLTSFLKNGRLSIRSFRRPNGM